jgi:hypothetical protein
MKKLPEIDYNSAAKIFEYSDKISNQRDLKLHECSKETPNEPGVYIGYEQFDRTDQYLVVWTGEKWIHFEYGGDIGFGDKCREDHWSELPNKNNKENPYSKIELPRFIKTSEVMVYQLNLVIDKIVKSDPNYFHNKKEVISENTELKFREFLLSINSDLNELRFS